MVSSWVCWASMPVLAIQSERIMNALLAVLERSSFQLESDDAAISRRFISLLSQQPRGAPARVRRAARRLRAVGRQQLGRRLLLPLGGLQQLHLVLELACRRDH